MDDGLSEAISTIIWAAPRIQTDVQEMKIISDILTSKYGKQYTDACREEAIQTISEKLKHKMSVQSPAKLLVEKYLIEIAKNYNIKYEADPQVLAEGQDSMLIDIGNNGGQVPNNLDQASGGPPQPAGFIGFPQPPMLPEGLNMNLNMNFNDGNHPPLGFGPPIVPPNVEKDQNNHFNPSDFSYNIPLDKANAGTSRLVSI